MLSVKAREAADTIFKVVGMIQAQPKNKVSNLHLKTNIYR